MFLIDVNFDLFFGFKVIASALLAFVNIPALVFTARYGFKRHYSHQQQCRQSIRHYAFHETKISFCAELTKFSCYFAWHMPGSASIKYFMKTRQVALSLYGSLFVLLFAASNINWGGKNWEDILEADARGYYAYLPAVFIYHDLNFEFFEDIELNKYPRKHLFYDYRNHYKGRHINKYFCGTALAELPFFALGHALALISGEEADGYTRLYFICINFGALVYAWLALVFLIRILRRYGISEGIIAFLIPVLLFGTNLFLYTVLDPGMSHVYSLAFFAMFIWLAQLFFEQPSLRRLYGLSLLLGIIVLIRPSNALIILSLPFIAGSYETLKAGFVFLFKRPLHLLFAALLGFSVLSLQLLAYKMATGDFLVYAYTKERFYFAQPHMAEILFSYRKGLFLYTPVLLIALSGYSALYRRSRFAAIAHAVFLLTICYVLSCWWMWWYGGGFSGRIFIEFFPFFFILLALLLQQLKRTWLKRSLYTLIVLLVLVCQIQIYQYRHYHIHWENTTREMYWDAFLRIDRLL